MMWCRETHDRPGKYSRNADTRELCCFHFSMLLPFVIYARCDECVTSRMEDSLRHSRSRINAYRALASPSLIALSSKDPILTAFELSWELRRLSFLEHEFKCEYQVSDEIFLSQLWLISRMLHIRRMKFRKFWFHVERNILLANVKWRTWLVSFTKRHFSFFEMFVSLRPTNKILDT